MAYRNGRLPDSVLAPIAGGRLRKDAAAAWNAMNVEARKQGVELRPTGSRSSYRTYAEQLGFWELYQQGRGALAARPGTSNHGWGLAVDVPTVAMQNMINRIGAPFGWQKAWSDAPCVPLTTRILTRDGFKPYDELQPGDETVGYNLATDESEWTLIAGVNVHEETPLTRYASGQLALTCTPNHRWVHIRKYNGDIRIHSLDAMYSQDRLLLAAAGAQGPGLELSIEECALLGWAMTDGSIYRFENSRGRRAFARVYQRKPIGVAAVDELMEHFPHRRDDGYRTGAGTGASPGASELTTMWYVGRGVFSEILHRSRLDETGPVRMVLTMTREQRHAWLEAVQLAEGTQPKMLEIAQARHVAGNEPMREAIAVAGFLKGHRIAMRARTVDLCNPTPFRNYLVAEPLEPDTVWCPTTTLGTWTAEQDGQVFITGNSEPWHFRWRVGHWSGPDPGPDDRGAQQQQQPAKPEPKRLEDEMRLAIAYNADGRVQQARIVGTGTGNHIEHQWMQQDGKWSGWRRVAVADGRTRPWVSVQYARHPNGRLELFAMTDSDTPWRIHQLGPNGSWADRLVRA